MLRVALFGVAIVVSVLVGVSGIYSHAEEPAVSNPELRELLVAKRDALNERLTLVKARFEIKAVQYVEVIQAHEPVLLAELELATTPQQRIQIYKKRVENFQYLEDRVVAEFQSGKATPDEKLRAQVSRIQSQIDLVRQSSSPSRP